MRYCDLHVHSNFSDGTLSPTQLVAQARQLGLTALALSDHNTVAGLPEFMQAAEAARLEAVPGCEFTSVWEGQELHILGLFIPREQWPTVQERMEDFRRRKDQNTLELLDALIAGGYPMDREAVLARGSGYINRAHVAAALKDAGYVPTIQAAFEKILAPGGGFYNPPLPMTSLEAIRFIRSIGAVPVLAHPLFSVGEEFLRSFLPLAREAGLAGMEVRYSKYSAADTALAAKLAKEYGLLPSGGSDFHGANRPDVPLGLPPVPYTWMTALRK
jgi:predicted metal-dependent phosphoesterase TrpH